MNEIDLENHSNYQYVGRESQLNVGDILVARRALPSTSYAFYQIVSFVRRSNTPRVRLLGCTGRRLVDEIAYRKTELIPRPNVFPELNYGEKPNVAKSLTINRDGKYQAKDDFGRPSELQKYDPAKNYFSEWYDQ